ncbi:hypothetical protein [Sinorhizobium meliloti]|nr:hypothetical protein [Sinorhizobium meliloti]MQW55240.1 hypothetical protein [Sinorhizobium meliloti]
MLGQTGGHENYFLSNVLHGISTASENEILTIIEQQSPDWISADGIS